MAFNCIDGKVIGLWRKVARIGNKWLVCVGVEAAVQRVYTGRFTFKKSDVPAEREPSIALRHQLNFLTSNEQYLRGRGVCFRLKHLSAYIYHIPV